MPPIVRSILVVFAGTILGFVLVAVLEGVSSLLHPLPPGLDFLLASAANLLMIPHPPWVSLLGLAEILPAAYLGASLTR